MGKVVLPSSPGRPRHRRDHADCRCRRLTPDRGVRRLGRPRRGRSAGHAVIFVVSGPGGVGKGTVVRRLLERDPKLWVSRSWTTRAPRPGEAPGRLQFATREEFEQHDRRRRIPRVGRVPRLPPGQPAARSARGQRRDVRDRRARRPADPRAVPRRGARSSWTRRQPEAQEARLRGRGDSDERVAQRLAKADEEAAVAEELGSIVVVNDELDRAVDEIEALIGPSSRNSGRGSEPDVFLEVAIPPRLTNAGPKPGFAAVSAGC